MSPSGLAINWPTYYISPSLQPDWQYRPTWLWSQTSSLPYGRLLGDCHAMHCPLPDLVVVLSLWLRRNAGNSAEWRWMPPPIWLDSRTTRAGQPVAMASDRTVCLLRAIASPTRSDGKSTPFGGANVSKTSGSRPEWCVTFTSLHTT